MSSAAAQVADEDRIEELERAITDDPTNAELHKELGNVFHRSMAFELALAEYRTAVKLDPDYFPAYYNMGNTYFEMDKAQQAIIQWQQALLIRPGLEMAIYNIGYAYYHLGAAEVDKDRKRRLLDDSIAWLQRALELEPEKGDTHLHMGLCWYELERYDEAIAAYERALECDHRDPAAHYNLGNVLYEKGVRDPRYFERALAEYEKAVEHDPTDLKSHNNIADCYLRMGKVKKARKAIKDVLAGYPDYLPAHCTLGEIFSREGNMEAAIGEFEMVLALEEEETGILHKYAGQHLIEELSVLAGQRPEDPQLRLRMGRAYKVLGLAYGDGGYLEKAVEEFQHAGATGTAVFLELGETYIRLRQFDLALGALDAVLEREPGHVTALSFKAEVFARLGDRDRTIELLRAIRKRAFA